MNKTVDRSKFDSLRHDLWTQIKDGIGDSDVQDIVGQVITELEKQGEMDDYFANRNGSAQINPLLNEISQGLSTQQKFQLANVMTLLIHAGRTASITATKQVTDNEPLIKLVADLKAGGATPDKILHQIKRPVMDNVFTTHPTYIGDYDYSTKLRAFDLAVFDNDEKKVEQAVEELLATNSVVEDRLTAQEEAHFMRHYLKNAYESMHYIYENFDEALQHNGIDYDPLDLKLNVNFQSWGSSGDKDGNINITFFSLEDAAKLHRRTIISSYKDDLKKMVDRLPDDAPNKTSLERGRKELDDLLGKLWQHPVNPEEGEVQNLMAALKLFTKNAYLSTLSDDKAVKPGYEESARKALALRRSLDIFGLDLGQIEFRETADEIEFVLNKIITPEMVEEQLGLENKHYSNLDDEQKAAMLNYAFDEANDERITAQFNDACTHIPPQVKARDYQYADSGVLDADKDKPKSEQRPDTNNGIFFHTIERLRLASRNPDMFRGQVLAEATGPAHVKEMLLLLKLTGTEKQMRIMPLFEDPDILRDMDGIMKNINHDPHIFKHMVDVSLTDWERDVEHGIKEPLAPETIEKLYTLADAVGTEHYDDTKQETEKYLLENHQLSISSIVKNQIQLAHSDNARRGGTAGARAGIYQAHQAARSQAFDAGIGMQFFEGGSHTDSFRMGVRSYKSLVNMYETHDFMKATVQGMDLAQIFSTPLTIEAFIEENIANATRVLAERSKGMNKLDERRGTGYHNRESTKSTALENMVMDEVARYRTDYFGGDGTDPSNPPNVVLGNIMAQVFNYAENNKSGTIGSRSAGRGKVKKDQTWYLNPVKDTRTIGYSETYQHGRFNPNYIGSKEIYDTIMDDGALRAALEKDEDNAKFKTELFVDAKSPTERLNFLYKNNQFMNDGIDRVAYAVATTDFDHVWDNAMHDYSTGEKQDRLLKIGDYNIKSDDSDTYVEVQIQERPKADQLDALAAKEPITTKQGQQTKSPDAFLAFLELEYRAAGKMVVEAITGKEYDIDGKETREITGKVRSLLGRYQDALHQQDVAMRVIDTIHHSTSKQDRAAPYENGGGIVSNALNKAIHNARDTATLVRPPFQREVDYLYPDKAQAQVASVARG